MPNDIYQQAKELFNELLDLKDTERERRLTKLDSAQPELATELRSLLQYHTSQSLVVPATGPKIRTRSTLATSYGGRPFAWLYSPAAKGLLFALPIFLLGLLFAYWSHGVAVQRLQSSVANNLSESIEGRLIQFRQWEALHVSKAVALSQHPEVIGPIDELVECARDLAAESSELCEALANSEASDDLNSALSRLMGQPAQYTVWDRRMLMLSCANSTAAPESLGALTITASGASMIAPVLKGNPKLFLPLPGRKILDGALADKATSDSVCIVVPIYKQDAIVAALMLHDFELTTEFDNMVLGWTKTPQSETFFVTERGLLLTPSRFAEDIEILDLAFDESGQSPIPIMRDPGVPLLRGQRPETTPSAWPPTVLARQVTSGYDGLDTAGYRNYVGEQVVGAWRWLPDHKLGIGLEVDYGSAFQLAAFLRNSLLGIATVFTIALCASSIANVYSSLRAKKLRSTGEVGPYQIQEVLGEGGMGRVYLAEHALLCRQSAVKVLTKGMSDLSVISRFEREVQLASQLTHPNTIAIYDFGRNTDGIFYYAMEYINGAHLGQLVEYRGPIQPGRCIYILRQLCRALVEAHAAGVVHRDIKPQNVMVCNRGGEPDFVKLFDYGLVKAFAPGVSHNSSQTKIVVGTPRFMAPERLNSPWLADPRVDVYSVGAVAYYLLTGMLPPLVTMDDGLDNQQTGIETLDLPLAVVDFGELLSECMAVEPSTRPSNMESLLTELNKLSEKYPWERKDSVSWWEKHEAKLLHLVRNKRKNMDNSGDTLIYGQDNTK